jgi:hypothetical protein
MRNLAHELRPISFIEIKQFNQAGPPRHQQQPRIVGVGHEENTGQR